MRLNFSCILSIFGLIGLVQSTEDAPFPDLAAFLPACGVRNSACLNSTAIANYVKVTCINQNLPDPSILITNSLAVCTNFTVQRSLSTCLIAGCLPSELTGKWYCLTWSIC